MTASEYETEFTRLLRYGGHLVPTEASKIQKFIAGLRPYLRRKIEIQEYPTLSRYISQLEKVERGEREKKEGKIRERSPAGRYFGTDSSGKNAQSNDPRNKGKAPAVRAPPPLAARGPVEIQEEEEEECAPDGAEAAAISGTLYLCGVACYTLFDNGATHSFLSVGVAERLETGEIEPRSDFTVRIPTGETLAVHGILRGIPLEICGRILATDLIVVPIGGFDIILGMDWLMEYQAYIDCPQRTIWFTDGFGGFEFRGIGDETGGYTRCPGVSGCVP
ncbi:PREDICTED: uncharacterized protein LOC109116329 [Tarenaya hassleriana]|uniref:uncharacterized protein LOC109116329 n=1 Tax=Tarenaya hassleriana TaxID=28532 RepID=UPI0008FD322B|nr:PREDICTED: uncharacterized protein LOC109116329 [Tarenaya hassleriana]